MADEPQASPSEVPGTGPEASEKRQERDPLLRRYMRKVAASGDKWDRTFREVRRNRLVMQGAIPDNVALRGEAAPIDDDLDLDDPRNHVVANLIQSTEEALLPLLYARNPDVSVRPAPHVHAESPEYGVIRQWAETLQVVVSDQLRHGGLKQQAKKAVRSVQSSKVGWLKVSYQQDYGTDPEIINRMNDAQDNLARVQGMIADLAEDSGDRDELEATAADLQLTLDSLQNSPEVVLAEGVVVDFIRMDNMRMDPAVDCVDQYLQAGWIAHFTMVSVEEYRSRFNIDADEDMEGVDIFVTQQDGRTENVKWREYGTSERGGGMVRLWELWDKNANTVCNWAEGANQFARRPWVPQNLGRRWYPFFLLGFHWLDDQEFPNASCEGLERLQQEYNDTRAQKSEHRRANVPHYLANSDVSPDNIKSFTVAGAREVVILDAGGRPLREVITPAEQIALNPAMYDTGDTRTDIQWMSGLQDAGRGGVIKAKTLGEAQIAQGHLASRISNYQEELDDFLTDIAEYVAEILLLRMSPDRVRQIAGPNAVWPQLQRKDVFDLFDLEIKAGSAGKPDEAQEREDWNQLIDVVVKLVDKIMALRQGGVDPRSGIQTPGMPDNQNPYVAILRETLKRYDQRLDLEQFLPPQAQPQPVAMAGPGGVPGGQVPAAGALPPGAPAHPGQPGGGVSPGLMQAVQQSMQQQSPAQ